ncbi:HEAT repeat-containing protein [Stigmatella aurantiaca]|uniref:HEAT repeat-containing protein n=1 Tax=Stigmatella aurantiaca TaxID=41 RepID=A0A1H8DK91_STIAU|nr:HEAT repeat domain-containing protein [Stigmatella aurantiaca]SEN07699.1 HEAT repeat-containing protein [Stigmatella aurantiaca]
MRPLPLASLLLLSLPVFAQATPPAPPGVQAREEPAPAARGGTVSEDTALLRGLLWATEPTPEEVRAMAIEDLALLADPRALNPLAALLWDPSPRIQAAALRAVALFQHPRAEEILTQVVRHTQLPDALKLQALDGLLYQRTASARATVGAVSKDPRLPAALQSAALSVLARWDVPRK